MVMASMSMIASTAEVAVAATATGTTITAAVTAAETKVAVNPEAKWEKEQIQ